jgi:hypothetical protein
MPISSAALREGVAAAVLAIASADGRARFLAAGSSRKTLALVPHALEMR